MVPEQVPTKPDHSSSFIVKLWELLDDEASAKYIHEHLSEIQTNASLAEAAIVRRMLFVLVLAAVFVLLRSASITEISVAQVTVRDVPFLSKLIPVIMSYCFYDIQHLTSMLLLYSITVSLVLTRTSPAIVQHDIEQIVLPPSTFTSEGMLARGTKGAITEIVTVFSILKMTVLAGLGPIAFVVYSQIQLFREFGSRDAWVWLGLVACTLLIVVGSLSSGQMLLYVGIRDIVQGRDPTA